MWFFYFFLFKIIDNISCCHSWNVIAVALYNYALHFQPVFLQQNVTFWGKCLFNFRDHFVLIFNNRILKLSESYLKLIAKPWTMNLGGFITLNCSVSCNLWHDMIYCIKYLSNFWRIFLWYGPIYVRSKCPEVDHHPWYFNVFVILLFYYFYLLAIGLSK